MKVKLNGNDFYEVTSSFGALDSVHSTPHTGLDLAMEIGTQLNSPVDGVITKVVDFGSNNIGKGVYIETEDHQTVIMGHLSSIKAQVGDKVQEGDFVALSGSTGNSTGGHLHLGLKDAGGHFANPQPLVDQQATEAIGNGFFGGIKDGVSGAWDNMTGIWDFLQKWHEVGFWRAMYGKSFFQVISDFFVELFRDIGTFVLQNSEVFFIMPSIAFIICTWVAGRNKFTKWIIPLWIGYLFSKFLYYTIGG